MFSIYTDGVVSDLLRYVELGEIEQYDFLREELSVLNAWMIFFASVFCCNYFSHNKYRDHIQYFLLK